MNQKYLHRAKGLKDASEKFDLFGQPTPTFNLNRKNKITSQIGVFVSLILITMVILFMSVKGVLLVQRNNPLITQAEIPSFFDSEFKFNLYDNNYRIAFGVQSYFTKDSKDDPNFVRWTANLVKEVDGKRSEKQIKFHKCVQEDFDQFYPIEKSSVKALN